ncbi:MAG: sigma-70 family RNA polymerase sigma factor [Planctomycetota bacterium]|nr:MAG: sigma-70 family RNA polymerase sigma factor [Planctomycetota bacterium]
MHTTAWSMVNGARGDGLEARACLERLINTYWKPAYYYARSRGMDHHAAADCIQEFFARMLAGDWLQTVERERGHFRGWLLTALRRWVGRARQATGMNRLTLVNDDIVQAYEREDQSAAPDDQFNRAWAKSCLDEAMRLMQEEQHRGARARQVQVFLAYLHMVTEDSGAVSYEDLSERFQVPVTTITNDLHRARALFKSYLLRVVQETVGEGHDPEQELAELRRWLV